jgi:hypothetical protein
MTSMVNMKKKLKVEDKDSRESTIATRVHAEKKKGFKKVRSDAGVIIKCL